MIFGIEELKLLGSALALVISTATVQMSIAGFVNKVRDEFNEKRIGRWARFSDTYDLLWGYTLGILFNIVFFLVARILQEQTAASPYAGFGLFLWWLYFVNLIAWIVGMIIDLIRAIWLPGKERPKAG